MRDFKKGLLVGISIIIGCGTFIASTSNETSKDRYVMVGSGIMMLDKWEGKLYMLNKNEDETLAQYWKLLQNIKPTEEENLPPVAK